VDHRVGFPNRVQELIADAFAPRRSADQAGDVDKFNRRRNDFSVLTSFASGTSLSSGTATTPTLGLLVEKA